MEWWIWRKMDIQKSEYGKQQSSGHGEIMDIGMSGYWEQSIRRRVDGVEW